MKRIGLTGGIATGKSTVTNLLRERGVPVFCADAEVHRLLNEDEAVRQFLRKTFGETIIQPDGSVDRKAIGANIFANKELKQRLEGELHPRVRQARQAFFQKHADNALAVADIPLLYETDDPATYDEIWVVFAPETLQRQRLREQRGWDETTITQRLAAQWPIEKKRELADVVLENTTSLEALKAQVTGVLAGF